MNLFPRQLSLAICALFLLGNLASCDKYSDDSPFPEVYTATIFTASNNQIVYAIDPETGDTKWKRALTGEIHATPVLFQEKLWVGSTNGTLYRLNHKDGSILDSLNLNAAIEGTPLIYNDFLIVPNGNTIKAINSTLDIVWTYDIGSQILASPTRRNIEGRGIDAIFISGMGNKVAALDGDGGLIWEYTPAVAGAFQSSPCVVNDSFLYIGNNNGYLYSLFTFDGTEKWSYKTGGQVRSSPIQIGGNVLVGSSDRNFYSVDSASGLLRWKVETQDIIVSSPSVYNQNVYFGGYDNNIYCIDIIDGKVKWKKPSFGLIKSSPTIYRGSVYLGSFDKNLYRLNALDGTQEWVKNINGQMECSAIIDSVGGVAVPSISGSYQY